MSKDNDEAEFEVVETTLELARKAIKRTLRDMRSGEHRKAFQAIKAERRKEAVDRAIAIGVQIRTLRAELDVIFEVDAATKKS